VKEVKIRYATKNDAEMLADLSWRTFFDAFAEHPKNAPDDLKAYMDSAFNAEQLSKELSDEKAIFLVAEIEGELAGYAKLLLDAIEPGVTAEKPIELCRLYSEQKFLGKGVGAALMYRCLKEAKRRERDVMWLGVWEYNPRAQAFYRKWKFEECGSHVFQLGNDPQTDLLMQRRVNLK
jgi:ribosomal protein S18 acetylase RimI-like enzyme